MPKQTSYIRTQVRLPPGLHSLVKVYADQQNLSMNESLIQLIQKSLTEDEVGTDQANTQAALEVIKKALKSQRN